MCRCWLSVLDYRCRIVHHRISVFFWLFFADFFSSGIEAMKEHGGEHGQSEAGCYP